MLAYESDNNYESDDDRESDRSYHPSDDDEERTDSEEALDDPFGDMLATAATDSTCITCWDSQSAPLLMRWAEAAGDGGAERRFPCVVLGSHQRFDELRRVLGRRLLPSASAPPPAFSPDDWELVTEGVDKDGRNQLQCVCTEQIRNYAVVRHRPSAASFVVGLVCLQRFVPERGTARRGTARGTARAAARQSEAGSAPELSAGSAPELDSSASESASALDSSSEWSASECSGTESDFSE